MLIARCAVFLAATLSGIVSAVVPDEPRFVTAADGARIAYYAPDEAQGVPLLVLSGGPGTDSRYMRVGDALDRLAEGRTLIFFDQRGTSRSAGSDGTETIDQYVADLEEIRKTVGTERLDLLGHSFGGYLAMAYTAKHPDRVRGLVLVDSAPPKLSDLTQLLDQVYPDRIEAWRAKRATLGQDAATSESAIFMSMEFVTDQAYRDYLEAVADFRDNFAVNDSLRLDMERLDYWPHVSRFKQPTLIVHGRFDAVVAPSNGWALHKAVVGSTFCMVEGAGHLPHIEKPDVFLAIVQPFLTSMDRGARGEAERQRAPSDPC